MLYTMFYSDKELKQKIKELEEEIENPELRKVREFLTGKLAAYHEVLKLVEQGHLQFVNKSSKST